MALRIIAAFAVLHGASAQLEQAAFSTAQANISVYLSAAAYCDKSTYLSRTFKGPASGFVATSVIYDSKTDTTGYIGYLPSDKSIYVVFRGTDSLKNWIEDLDALKTDYVSYPECKCQVHKGFYIDEQAVISFVVSEVKKLMSAHTGYAVKVTGHSLGAALAQLASMDILKAGIPCTVYNFGQPRTGDKTFASFASSKLPIWRMTHNKDQVPHLPFTTQMEFYHVCREEFEDANHKLKTCDTSCEDPTCADQYEFAETNWDDHGIYLNLQMSCTSNV
jgi:hypothetical protein